MHVVYNQFCVAVITGSTGRSLADMLPFVLRLMGLKKGLICHDLEFTTKRSIQNKEGRICEMLFDSTYISLFYW